MLSLLGLTKAVHELVETRFAITFEVLEAESFVSRLQENKIRYLGDFIKNKLRM